MKTCLFDPRVRLARLHRLLVPSFVAAGLVSCGGGGGGGGGGQGGGGSVDPSFNITRPAFSAGVRAIAPAIHGAVDPEFDIGTGFNSTVLAIAEAADGSGDVYVGGTFTGYNGVVSDQTIRLHADGTRDLGFTYATGFEFGHIQVITPALDGSGDVYVGGDFLGYDGVSSLNLVRLNSDGSRDAAFSVGSGFDDDVEAIAVALDGSGDVYVAGQFWSYDGTGAGGIVRLNADGSRDTGFATGTGFDNDALALVLATDGSGDVYVGGSFSAYNGVSLEGMVRLNPNGTVDSGFATGAGFDDGVLALALALDGSGDVYVGGQFGNFNGANSNGLIRLNGDGTRDAGFDVGAGFDERVFALAAATDGSGDVYAGGMFTSYDGTGSNRLARLNPDGSQDTGFLVGQGFDSIVSAITLAARSGDAYVGGSFTTYDGLTAAGIVRLEVGRTFVGGSFVNASGSSISNRIATLEADDSIDTGFAVGAGFDLPVNAVVAANDGSGDVYAGGVFSSYNGAGADYIARLDPDGTLDTGFASGASFNSAVFAIAPAADGLGDVYAGGLFTSYQGTGSNFLIRLNSDGTPDLAFAVGSGFTSHVNAIALATDDSGDVYVGGNFLFYDGVGARHLLRINADGTRDSAFDVGTAFDDDVLALAATTDGSGDIYVGGFFTSYDGMVANRIVRLNADGTVDSGFDPGAGFDFDVQAISLAADGSGAIYVGGEFVSYDGQGSNRIVRLNPDGSRDTGFSVGSGFDARVLTIAPVADNSGGIYVGGLFLSFNGIGSHGLIRLDSNGSVSVGFGSGAGLDDDVLAIAQATDGSGDVYFGGKFGAHDGASSRGFIRLNADGTRDTVAVGTGFDSDVYALASAAGSSGDVYVGGRFGGYDGFASESLIRLNRDGTRDAGFDVGSGFNDPVSALALATDGSGDVYAGGDFNDYNGTSTASIIRLNSDGTVDSGFSVGLGFVGKVLSIAPATDGSGDIYVGGNLYSYGGVTLHHLARLNADGTLDAGFDIGAGFEFTAEVHSIMPVTDGSGDVYVGGEFNSYDGVNVRGLVRINSDGTMDTGFTIGNGFNDDVTGVAPASGTGGGIYVAGFFTSYDGVSANGIVRLEADGTRDLSFAVGTGLDAGAWALSEATDGSRDLYLGGVFYLYNGGRVDYAAALNPDGTLD